MITLMPAPDLAVLKASIVFSRGKWCVTIGFTLMAPLATMSRAAFQLKTERYVQGQGHHILAREWLASIFVSCVFTRLLY